MQIQEKQRNRNRHMIKTTENTKPIIVQKYGGTSLADAGLIKKVAKNIIAKKEKGYDLVVVVSAMGKTTDHFIDLAYQVSPDPDRREMDMLLSVGERISISLLAMAINASGKHHAVSYTGSQVGIITDDNHTQAQILEVKGHRLRQALEEGKIVIVAGFQGVSVSKEITTLGRGGSDTTAVALAAALNAQACEIMSDVDGIYSADPNQIPTARRIDRLDFEQALAIASSGARVLQKAAVEFAKRHNVKLSLGSSFNGEIGTIVTDESMSKGCVTAVVVDDDLVVFRGKLNKAEAIKLAHTLSLEKLICKVWQFAGNNVLLGVSKSDANLLNRILKTTEGFSRNGQTSLLALIGTGVGIGSSPAAKFFETLKESSCKYETVISNEFSLKILLENEETQRAVMAVHEAFF